MAKQFEIDSARTWRAPGRRLAAVLLGASCLAAVCAGRALAADATDAAASSNQVEELEVLAPAMHISPSNVPLDVVQPTSSVPSGFLKNNIIPLASFDDIIKFQPSVWSFNPNGPGIGKAEAITLRGFQDGQYNVTFDGIPFGDSTDLHHTSSALFIAHDLGEAEVDRGPGTASTIGKATFGGTIGFRSKTPEDRFGLDVYGTYGSFNTRAGGLEFDTGRSALGAGFIDYQHEETDGYLTHSNERRSNVFGKYDFNLGPTTTLTVSGSYNHEFQYTTQGATLAEYQQYGLNYGLCSDPKLQCYYGYQGSNYYSDFEYAQLKTEWNGLKIDEMLYTNSFSHVYTGSKDASDNVFADNGTTTFYSATTIGQKLSTVTGDVPGKSTNAGFRSVGDILRLSYEAPQHFELRTGVWWDRQADRRWSETVDMTQGGIPVVAKTGTPYSYYYTNVATTWQPYGEVVWSGIDKLKVTAGVKYTDFNRSVDALVNKNTKLPLNTSQSFNAWQPSVAANYQIMPEWTAYGQVAKGFLAPPIDVFQVNDIVPLKPEETWNYQLGTSARHDRWMLGADVYYIDFSNFLASTQVPNSTDTTFVNGGGAIYKGVELEAQYALGHGLSLYGNFSYTSAKYKHTDTWVAFTPEWLSSFGILYENKSGPYFSLIAKLVGPHYGLDNTTNGSGQTVFANGQRIHEVYTADFAGGWRFNNVPAPLHDLTASIKIGNLFDNRTVTDYAGTQSVGGAALFWRSPGRSIFFNLEARAF